MARFQFDELTPDQLSSKIRAAERISAYNVASDEQVWEWNRYDPETREITQPIKKVELLDVVTSSAEQLSSLRATVAKVKQGVPTKTMQRRCESCDKQTPHYTAGNQFDNEDREYHTFECSICQRWEKEYTQPPA